jgi:hypothetical protein
MVILQSTIEPKRRFLRFVVNRWVSKEYGRSMAATIAMLEDAVRAPRPTSRRRGVDAIKVAVVVGVLGRAEFKFAATRSNAFRAARDCGILLMHF